MMEKSTGQWVSMASDAIGWARRNALSASVGLAVVGLLVLAIECVIVLALAGYARPLDSSTRTIIVAAIVASGLVITAIAKAVQSTYGSVVDGAWEITWWTPGDHDLLFMIVVMIATGGVWLMWNAIADILRRGVYRADETEYAAEVLGVLLRAAEAQPIPSLPKPRNGATLARSVRLLTDLGLADLSPKSGRVWATTHAYRHARTVRERVGA